jgi:uncharacterized membrane protein AbrB (regulator of aidB expression)
MVFKHSKKWYFWASCIAWAVGALLCLLPPILATIINFPMMVTKNTDSTVSIFFILGILIAVAVVFQSVVKAFKDNTLLSVFVVLVAITAVLIAGYNMEKETILGLIKVSCSAAGGTLFGLVSFKLHHFWNDLYKNCGEVYLNDREVN